MNSFFKNPLLYLFAFLLMLTSCVKKEFDEPPAGGSDPNLTANMTIDSLKIKYYHAGQVDTIKDDVIIMGTVIADDKSGNFYKTMVLQDSSAGISVRIDLSSFYTQYPIGRRVFVKCKGLVIGDYGGLIQLGGYADLTQNPPEAGPIPSTLVSEYLIPGVYNLTVEPKELTIPQLNNKYQNMLIKLKDVEFSPADTSEPYADAVNQLSVNRIVRDCNGNEVILRSSGYASFATALTPADNGELTAVYSVFGSDKQLLIRNLNDVNLDSTRCGGAGGANDIIALRNLWNGGSTLCPNGTIKGIVISDYVNGSIDGRNMVIQDATGGIVVRFSNSHNFALGDEVEINIGGLSMTEFHGLLEVNNTPNANAIKTGTGTVTPLVATITDITNNAEQWESTLVQINDVSFPATPGTYSGSVTITDPGNATTLYTRSGATFSGSSYPNSGTHTVTCFIYPYDVLQVVIRNLNDVQ